MDNEVKINIGTTADTSGAKEVASSLNQVEQAVGQAAAATGKNTNAVDFGAQSDRKAAVDKRDKARAANTATKSLNELGEATEKGANAGRVLGEIMRGNIGYVAQLGSSFKALGAVLKANTFGVVLTAATLLWNFLPGLLERMGLLKDKTKESGDAADTTAKQISAFGETDVNFDKLTKKLGELREQFDTVTAAVDRLRNATDAVAGAKTDLAVADVDRREAEALSNQNLSDDEKRRLKDQFAMERDGIRQVAAEKSADDQVARSREKILLNQREQQGNVEEQGKLAVSEVEAKRRLKTYEDDAQGLKRVIAGAGDPLNQTDSQKKLVAQAKAELEPIEKAIAEGKVTLEKIQAEQAQAKKRGDEIGNQAAPLREQAVAADLNAATVRQRGETAATAAANARKAANKAAIEAAQPGSTGPMFGPAGEMPLYVPPPPPSFRVNGIDRSELLRPPLTPIPPRSTAKMEIDGRDRSDLLPSIKSAEKAVREAPSPPRSTAKMEIDGRDRSDLLPSIKSAEKAVREAPSLEGITGALSGLVGAIESKSATDTASIRSLEQRMGKAESQLRNGREGK